MVERALRGVIRDVLARAAQEGAMRSAHPFLYRASRRQAPGVVLLARLLERFPSRRSPSCCSTRITGTSDVGDEAFSVVARSFSSKQVERLTIPFAAVKSFADPSVEFALAFAEPAPRRRSNEPAHCRCRRRPGREAKRPPRSCAAPEERGQVVTLDSFRKR